MNKQPYILEQIEDYINETMSSEERQEFEAKLETDATLQEKVTETKQLLESLEGHRGRKEMKAMLGEIAQENRNRKGLFFLKRKGFLSVAAAVALILVATFSWNWLKSDYQNKAETLSQAIEQQQPESNEPYSESIPLGNKKIGDYSSSDEKKQADESLAPPPPPPAEIIEMEFEEGLTLYDMDVEEGLASSMTSDESIERVDYTTGEARNFNDGAMEESSIVTGIQSNGRPQKPSSKRAKAKANTYAWNKDVAEKEEAHPHDKFYREPQSRESYDKIYENEFLNPGDAPLSTFSIDVDNASYTNIRRMINNGQRPQAGAVRLEEMVNYFKYDYATPSNDEPFAIHTSLTTCPWNRQHQLMHVGLKGREIKTLEQPNSNLVFLLDVSGSMSDANKLPLLIDAFKILLSDLSSKDRVAIVTYAGAAGLVLPSTPASEKSTILTALENLNAGGSTAGGQGIELAYKVAKEGFIRGGNNRVILATDGDFNVGVSSNAGLVELIEQKRKQGVFLTVCGFGMGNYNDAMMEQVSNAGDGNYFYIDNVKEAQKVFGHDLKGNLFTIAKDVKIQIEFNPAYVEGYRLLGYENRKLAARDFNDDTKDAGELGSGHTVTAIYELIPTGSKELINAVDPLRYSQRKDQKVSNNYNNELAQIKLRYKAPKGGASKLTTQIVPAGKLRSFDNNTGWSTTVVGFGLLLRNSAFKGNISREMILRMANDYRGSDPFGYRKEFIELVGKTR